MKKPLLITLIIILIIILLIMKKLLTLSTATSLAITSVVPNTTQAQATDNTKESQPIKHELARMPEQASWTVERWNINDVDFELKEISKATKNQPAQFEFKVEIPSKGSNKLSNPIASYQREDKMYEIAICKKSQIYHTQIKNKKTLNYWNMLGLQMLDIKGKIVRNINKNSSDYINYQKSDFPIALPLVLEKYFRGGRIQLANATKCGNESRASLGG